MRLSPLPLESTPYSLCSYLRDILPSYSGRLLIYLHMFTRSFSRRTSAARRAYSILPNRPNVPQHPFDGLQALAAAQAGKVRTRRPVTIVKPAQIYITVKTNEITVQEKEVKGQRNKIFGCGAFKSCVN